MKSRVIHSGEERAMLARLGQTIRLGSPRRDLSQADFAQRMGVARSTLASLEAGDEGVSIGALLKAMSVLGYAERFGEMLASDPIGDDIDEAIGRRRAGRRSDTVAF